MKGWIITAGVVLVLGAGIYALTRPDPVEVRLETVERGVVEATVANTRAGTVEACQRSRLSLAIGGQIERLHVEEGETVVAGEVLVTLWNRDRQARVAEAEAALGSARQERESLCAQARSDEREAKRLISLAERKLVSEESVDLAKARAETSAARCEAAAARREQAAAALEVARANLSQTELTAPFAGVIAEVTGEVGEYATPSPPGIPTPPLIDLMSDDCHYIAAPIDEVDAAAIRVGMPVRVTLDAYRGRDFSATVSRIAPYVLDREKQARTVEVEAVLDELPEDVRLLTGYSADMEIILETRTDTLRLPTEVVFDGRYVLVPEQGRLVKRRVSTGLSNWRVTEITQGLTAGDRVVANIGSAGVEEGVPVTIADGEASADGDD